MRLSASTLDMYIKCGYKYKLTKVDGLEEPGKMSYGTLEGRVVGTAIQTLSQAINELSLSELPDALLSNHLYHAYVTEFKEGGIHEDILIPIGELLTDGISPGVMNQIDQMSVAIACSQKYKYNPLPPAKIKDGAYSTDKRRLGMKILATYQAIKDHLSPSKFWFNLIRDAKTLEAEKYFEFILREDEFEPDYIPGYLDQYIEMADGRQFIFELKYKSMPYTQQLVEHTNQVQIYQMAFPKAEVYLMDVAHGGAYRYQGDASVVKLKYDMVLKAIDQGIFIPFCGVDSFSTKTMLCGFKCGGCPYATETQDSTVLLPELA